MFIFQTFAKFTFFSVQFMIHIITYLNVLLSFILKNAVRHDISVITLDCNNSKCRRHDTHSSS